MIAQPRNRFFLLLLYEFQCTFGLIKWLMYWSKLENWVMAMKNEPTLKRSDLHFEGTNLNTFEFSRIKLIRRRWKMTSVFKGFLPLIFGAKIQNWREIFIPLAIWQTTKAFVIDLKGTWKGNYYYAHQHTHAHVISQAHWKVRDNWLIGS